MTQVPAMDQVVESPAEGMPPPSARPAAQPHNVSTASTITAASDTLDMAVSPALSEDGSALVSASWRAQEHSSPDASTKSSDALSQVKEESIGESSSAPQDTPSMPVQKRRRVTRACDECRRKKIKCDGKQPCTHCSVYSYECTYDKPSNRRRNPAPQYIEALEHRLQRAETLLRKFMPEVDLSDPNLDPAVQQEFQNRERARNQAAKSEKQQDKQVQQPENQDSQILSMIETIGQLDLTEGGEWDFHGISSGAVFLRRLREHFGGLLGQDYKAPFLPRAPRLPGMFNLDSPRSSVSSPWDPALQNVYDLPPKEHARTLCLYSFQCATCLLRIVHVPTFFETFDRLYQKSPETFGTEDNRTLGLLYAVLALGCVYNFSDDSAHHYQAAMEEGLKYFSTSRLLLQDITECRDLASLQALLYLILFLQATSDLSGCYAFLGIALRAAMRMGLHRHLPHAQLTPIEHESRRRVFYVIRQMDTYVSALLGFPLMLSNQDIDQPLPTEVDDEYITKDGILSPPAGSPSVFEAFNAHAKLLDILAKVIKHIYPLKGIEDCVMSGEKESATYLINYSKIKEIEQELHEWFEKLPEQWRPSAEGPIEVVRIRTLLRFGYAHVQMMLYRPFLHYVSPRLSAGKNVDERYYACAAAGISVARNIVHIGMEIRKKAVVIGPYWFILYTQYFAILSLLFYALENPDKAGSPEILAEATAGRDVIASLSSRSSAADRVTASLNVVFERLPDHLKKGKGRPIPTKKRSLGPKASPIPMPPTTAPGRRSEDSQSHKGSAAQDARRHASHRMSFDTAHRPQNARPGQQFISNFPEMLSMDLSSATGSPESSGTPSTSYRSIPSVPAHQTPGGAANPLYKLDTMMFPSGDPFAYPNQPMADMQTPTSGPHPGQAGPGHHQDAIQFYIPPNVYDDIEGQLLGPVPPYLMQQAQGQQGMDLQSHMYNASGMLGMHTQNTHTQQQHQEQQHHQMTQQRQHRELEEMLADPNFDPNFVEMFPQNYHRQI